jgi:phosphonate transport system substrate-binding protein
VIDDQSFFLTARIRLVRWISLVLLLLFMNVGCDRNPPTPPPVIQEASVAEEGPEYSFGVVPQWGTDRLLENWQPLVARLREDTGLNLKLDVTFSIPSFEKGFSEGDYDFAYMNPYHFVCAQRDQGYVPLIRDYDKQLTGILVASVTSDIEKIEDLQGKRIDFPSPNALGASLYMRALLARQFGIEFEPKFVKTHESVYLNVISGEAFAGGGVRRTLESQDPAIQQQLRVIYETPGVAPHPIAYHPRVPGEVVEKVQTAILALAKTEAGQELLAGIPMSQPGLAVREDYQPLIDLQLEEFYQEPK